MVTSIKKDKQDYNLNRYAKSLTEGRETYQKRIEYLKNFSMKKKKSKGGSEEGSGEPSTGGGGSVVLNGDLPTIQQYQGPDTYFDKIINDNYQSGLKAKLEGTDKWNKDIMEQSAKAGVNPLFVKIIMATESGGKHSATPNAYNCVGLMQVQDKTAASLGLNWSKVKSDSTYNIYAGCLVMKEKHNYAKNLIKGNGSRYREFKGRGYELKPNCHGAAWLYNGFSVPSNGSSKVTTGGYIYANQIAAMYKGFGRDAYADTVLTIDVLGNSSNQSDATKKKKQEVSEVGTKGFLMQSTSMDLKTAPIEGPVRGELSEPEEEYMQQRIYSYNVPVGKMKGNYFNPPKYLRERYVEDRKNSMMFAQRTDYAPLTPNDFIHTGGPQENYYSKEARELFQFLKNKLKYRQMIVTRGYEPVFDGNDTSHALGIAMDIYAPTPAEAIRIADTAWLLGVRSIAIGPKFVHIDSGPESVWGYDKGPVYRGPGTVKMGGLERAYR